jgi:hypothetical protein
MVQLYTSLSCIILTKGGMFPGVREPGDSPWSRAGLRQRIPQLLAQLQRKAATTALIALRNARIY